MIARSSVTLPHSIELLDSDIFVDVYNKRQLATHVFSAPFCPKKLSWQNKKFTIKGTVSSARRSPLSIRRRRSCYRRVAYLETTRVWGKESFECFQRVSRVFLEIIQNEKNKFDPVCRIAALSLLKNEWRHVDSTTQPLKHLPLPAKPSFCQV